MIQINANVEIRCKPGDFFSIDFEGFAITFFREAHGSSIAINAGVSYEKDYWSFLCGLDGVGHTCELRSIPPPDFKAIEYIVQGLYCCTQEQFKDFLAQVFPDCAMIFVS